MDRKQSVPVCFIIIFVRGLGAGKKSLSRRKRNMKIGCVKEIKNNEFRVGLTPDNVKAYVAAGHPSTSMPVRL